LRFRTSLEPAMTNSACEKLYGEGSRVSETRDRCGDVGPGAYYLAIRMKGGGAAAHTLVKQAMRRKNQCYATRTTYIRVNSVHTIFHVLILWTT
jgi:hypothetical protein